MQVVDNRGLACPEPVIRTKKALDAIAAGTIVSIVDNQAAKENVLRLVQNLGLAAEVTDEQGGIHRITINKGTACEAAVEVLSQRQQRTTLLIKSDLMGEGEAQLGQALMKSFFYALTESDDLPATIFFLNGGVKLTCQGSPVLDRLQLLQDKGVQLWSCGTCLDFYRLQEQLAIGDVTNMYSIVESLLQADKTITL